MKTMPPRPRSGRDASRTTFARDRSRVDESLREAAVVQPSSVDTALRGEPSGDVPSGGAPAIGGSSVDGSSVVESPIVEASVDESSVDGSSVDGSSVDGSSVDESSMDESWMDESSRDDASVDESATGESATVGSSVDEASVDEPNAASLPRSHRPGPSLMARAIALLARREHGRVELGRKLQRRLGPDESMADVERVLDRLAAQQLLSDARFAAALVRQRSVRYGDLRVAHDLRLRGVPAAEATAAMALVEGSEAQRALAVWARRFDALPTSAAERGRQGRFLQARGFSMTVITRILAGKVEASE